MPVRGFNLYMTAQTVHLSSWTFDLVRNLLSDSSITTTIRGNHKHCLELSYYYSAVQHHCSN